MDVELKHHFNLRELPFDLTPNLNFFCSLENYQNIIDAVTASVSAGDAIVKIVGEVGTGKTLLCRKLIHDFDQLNYMTLYIHNPSFSAETILRLIADELAIEHQSQDSEYDLHKRITKRLLALYEEKRRVVLLIDEAQTLSEQALESVRLLTNLESEQEKLIQIILFGQPELDTTLSKKSLRQLRQRIAFNYVLPSLAAEDANIYIERRLISAGHETGILFSKKSSQMLHKICAGTPRVMNILAYKALLSSYARGKKTVDVVSIKEAAADSKDIISTLQKNRWEWFDRFVFWGLGLCSVLFVVMVTLLLN